MEAILAKAAGEDLAATLSEVGRLPEDDRTVRTEQTEENTARITVRLTNGGRGADRIAGSAQQAVATLYGLETTWEVGDSALSQALGRTGPPVEVEISGRSLEDLRQAAAMIRERFTKESALWNVRTSFEGGPPEIRIVLRRSVAEGLGIDLAVVARTIEASLDGRRATVLSTGDEEKDVVIHLPEPRLETLAQIPVESAGGARVALGAIAELIPAAGAREIFRRDQRRVATVTARIAPDRDYPAAVTAATEALAEVDLPAGLRARLVGEEQERAETFNELKLAGILAMLLVFMVLAGSFESLIHPLTVITAVPIAWLGVAGVLITLGNPIGVMELLGMIVLTGIAVNDAILLVDTARRGIGSGLSLDAALARAASIRLRPILMTSATTILALLPLALGSGEAAELRRPMAWTIIGGLVASTIGSLLITPAVYRLLDGLSRRRRTEEV
jgi:HAE1 family hydrophobic/amphiphilic exporter-1